jgi:hypothetical protein
MRFALPPVRATSATLPPGFSASSLPEKTKFAVVVDKQGVPSVVANTMVIARVEYEWLPAANQPPMPLRAERIIVTTVDGTVYVNTELAKFKYGYTADLGMLDFAHH